MKEPRTVYHDITLNTGGMGGEYLAGCKEEVTLEYGAEWRSRPVIVRMTASRYRSSPSSGGDWSTWNIYPSEAREDVSEGLGTSLTETARSRLGDDHRADAVAWLVSSDASRTQAYAHAIRQFARNMKPYSTPPSHDLRRAITANADHLLPDAIERFEAAADAYDTFVNTINS